MHPTEFGGSKWTIEDNSLIYTLRLIDWMDGTRIYVYHDYDEGEFHEIPADTYFGMTARRAVRSDQGKERQVLEDVGITPTHLYYMTKDDVLGKNHGLYLFATSILHNMPSYELKDTHQANPKNNLQIETKNLERVEIVANNLHFLSVDFNTSSDINVDLTNVATGSKLLIKGFKANQVVARRKLII